MCQFATKLNAKVQTFIVMMAASVLLSGCGSMSGFFAKTEDPSKMAVEALYKRAKDALSAGSYAEAIKLYETLESRFPYGVQSQQAILDSAYAQYKLNERTQSIASADRFIKLYPNHENVDYAYYIKGLANFIEDLGLLSFVAAQDLSERDQKSARESYNTFKTLAEKFPQSKYNADAKQRLRYLVNALSQNESHIARYYFNRGAYQAAINRAQACLINFPNTPANEEALRIMVQSYAAMGNTQLAADTDRIYKSTFQRNAQASGSAWWKFW
jgi:outer membrane protein assembly factor BamD